MAPCQPRQFRRAAARKGRADARLRRGKSRWTAAHLPPAAAHRLLLQPVSVLPELHRGGLGVPDLVASDSSGAVAVPAGSLSLRRIGRQLVFERVRFTQAAMTRD